MTLVIGGLALLILPRRTSYLMIEPGNTFATEHLITVQDAGPLVDDAEGTVVDTDFVTVSRRSASLFDLWVRKRLDPTILYEPRQEVYGDHSKQEVDKLNTQQMVDSKLIAQMVAVNYLGVDVNPLGDGAAIVQFVEGSPISKATKLGDVITAIGDGPVRTADDLRGLLAGRKPGDSVSLTIHELVLNNPDKPDEGYRTDAEGKYVLGPKRTESVAMMQDPDSGRTILGIVPQTLNFDMNLPVTLDMDSGRVSGPSAGLAWTLATIDRLSPGDLNGGVRVAATGEMAPDGSVLAIGGLPQKAVAVQRAGITHFLIPESSSDEEVAQAKEFTEGKVTFHRVATVGDAVEAMKALAGDTPSGGSVAQSGESTRPEG